MIKERNITCLHKTKIMPSLVSQSATKRSTSRITLSLICYSFGIETTNMLIHNRQNRSSFVNQSRFQTKMCKIYTRSQTKTAQNPYPLGRNIPIWLGVPPPPHPRGPYICTTTSAGVFDVGTITLVYYYQEVRYISLSAGPQSMTIFLLY